MLVDFQGGYDHKKLFADNGDLAALGNVFLAVAGNAGGGSPSPMTPVSVSGRNSTGGTPGVSSTAGPTISPASSGRGIAETQMESDDGLLLGLPNANAATTAAKAKAAGRVRRSPEQVEAESMDALRVAFEALLAELPQFPVNPKGTTFGSLDRLLTRRLKESTDSRMFASHPEIKRYRELLDTIRNVCKIAKEFLDAKVIKRKNLAPEFVKIMKQLQSSQLDWFKAFPREVQDLYFQTFMETQVLEGNWDPMIEACSPETNAEIPQSDLLARTVKLFTAAVGIIGATFDKKLGSKSEPEEKAAVVDEAALMLTSLCESLLPKTITDLRADISALGAICSFKPLEGEPDLEKSLTLAKERSEEPLLQSFHAIGISTDIMKKASMVNGRLRSALEAGRAAEECLKGFESLQGHATVKRYIATGLKDDAEATLKDLEGLHSALVMADGLAEKLLALLEAKPENQLAKSTTEARTLFMDTSHLLLHHAAGHLSVPIKLVAQICEAGKAFNLQAPAWDLVANDTPTPTFTLAPHIQLMECFMLQGDEPGVFKSLRILMGRCLFDDTTHKMWKTCHAFRELVRPSVAKSSTRTQEIQGPLTLPSPVDEYVLVPFKLQSLAEHLLSLSLLFTVITVTVT